MKEQLKSLYKVEFESPQKSRSSPDTERNCQKKQNVERTEIEDTHHFRQVCNSQIFPIAVIFVNKTNPKLKFTLYNTI